MKDIDSDQQWSKKRIILGLIILTTLVAALSYGSKYVLNQTDKIKGMVKAEKIENKQVQQNQETNSEDNFEKINPQEALQMKTSLQEKLDSVKQQVNSLNIADLATSSPQVKKVISDLKNLEQLPKNQVKEACFSICEGI